MRRRHTRTNGAARLAADADADADEDDADETEALREERWDPERERMVGLMMMRRARRRRRRKGEASRRTSG